MPLDYSLSMYAAAEQLQDTYRREARRVRARLRHRPGEMYAALKQLAHRIDRRRWSAGDSASRTDRASRAERIVTPVTSSRIDDRSVEAMAEMRFEQLVRQHVTGPVLRYSVRQALLARAERLGVGRFEANLIIATMQHQRRHLVEQADAAQPADRDGGILLPLVVVGVLQGLIVAAAWWLIG